MSKTTGSSGELDETSLQSLFDAMYDSPNGPVKILTPMDFKRRKMGTYMGMPIVVDPLIGKDEIWVEYRDGTREPLNRMDAAGVRNVTD